MSARVLLSGVARFFRGFIIGVFGGWFLLLSTAKQLLETLHPQTKGNDQTLRAVRTIYYAMEGCVPLQWRFG